MQGLERFEIERGLTEGLHRYFEQRRGRIAPFATEHFGWKGAWRLNRRAFGKDLLRTPANVAWAGPYLLLRGVGSLGRKAGLGGIAARFERLPAGFKTDVERELEWLLYSELLELPFDDGARRCERDALLEAVLRTPAVEVLFREALAELDALASRRPQARERLARFLGDYASTRTAAAELSGALLNLAAGAAAFQQLTPGVVGMGSAAAAGIAQQLAIANFALGPTLGSLYYGAFPVAASTGLLAATTGGLMALFGVVSALSGIVTDPLQQRLGLHARRLHRLLDALEAEWSRGEGRLVLRDAYAARVFDLIDLLQAAARALS